MYFQTLKRGQQRVGVGSNLFSKSGQAVILVRDTKSPTRVNVFNRVTVCPQSPRQLSYSLHRFSERLYVGDLGANVYADAGNLQRLPFRRLSVKSASVVNGYAEFVLMQAGGNIRMRLGRNVRIHTESNPGFFLYSGSGFCERPQFRLALNVEK